MSRYLVEDVTHAQHVASIVAGTAKTNVVATAKNIAHRIPVHLCAQVDAMAQTAGKSRNAMINLLINVGLQEVRAEVSLEVGEALTIAEARAISMLMDQRLVRDIDSLEE